MQARKTIPRIANTWTRFRPVQAISVGASTLLISSAPKPKPMTTMPVTKPFLSGNHLATVATGVTYPRPSPVPPTMP